jgi:hypothetical protein
MSMIVAGPPLWTLAANSPGQALASRLRVHRRVTLKRRHHPPGGLVIHIADAADSIGDGPSHGARAANHALYHCRRNATQRAADPGADSRARKAIYRALPLTSARGTAQDSASASTRRHATT